MASIVLTTALCLLAAASSAHAAYPGANGKLVFVKGGNLWTIEADGRKPARLTRTTLREYAPSWSPDGTKLAYVLDYGIVIANADGSGAVDISAESLKGTDNEDLGPCDSDPTWSPDGRWIAFSTGSFDCTGAAYVLDKMTPAGTRRSVIEHDYDGLLGGDTEAAWGPGGSRILITRSDSLRMASGPYVSDIYALDARTGKVARRLTTSNHASAPSWSPDGKRIAFVVSSVVKSGEIATMTASGRGVEVLARGSDPAWSPNGKWIAFVDARGIELIRPDGTGKRLLYACKGCADLDWQPVPSRSVSRRPAQATA